MASAQKTGFLCGARGALRALRASGGPSAACRSARTRSTPLPQPALPPARPLPAAGAPAHLCKHPAAKRADPRVGVGVCLVWGTPFDTCQACREPEMWAEGSVGQFSKILSTAPALALCSPFSRHPCTAQKSPCRPTWTHAGREIHNRKAQSSWASSYGAGPAPVCLPQNQGSSPPLWGAEKFSAKRHTTA